MEINKQLFEDVLAGKLKGTFVLRSCEKIPSDALRFHRLYYGLHIDGRLYLYYDNGGYSSCSETRADIIDFIPDTDMKENELTIEIPNNKVVDWEESKKQNKIVLKDKQLTYEDVCNKLFQSNAFYYICRNGAIGKMSSTEASSCFDCLLDVNNATTKHQLECILAKNKLATVAKYLNDGWKVYPDSFGYIIINGGFTKFKIEYTAVYSIVSSSRIVFKSRELAQQAIEILGEETVKLALEPLGI